MTEPLEVWVERNAEQLNKDFAVHLEVYGIVPEDMDSCLRMLMTSLRQWDNQRPTMTVFREVAKSVCASHFDAIYHDSHNWSTRPCGTCDPISHSLGFVVGCSRYRKEERIKREQRG